MATWDVEINATVEVSIQSATISVEADTYEEAEYIVRNTSYSPDDLGIDLSYYASDLDIHIDWTDCEGCGIRDSDDHDSDCPYYEATVDEEFFAGVGL